MSIGVGEEDASAVADAVVASGVVSVSDSMAAKSVDRPGREESVAGGGAGETGARIVAHEMLGVATAQAPRIDSRMVVKSGKDGVIAAACAIVVNDVAARGRDRSSGKSRKAADKCDRAREPTEPPPPPTAPRERAAFGPVPSSLPAPPLVRVHRLLLSTVHTIRESCQGGAHPRLLSMHRGTILRTHVWRNARRPAAPPPTAFVVQCHRLRRSLCRLCTRASPGGETAESDRPGCRRARSRCAQCNHPLDRRGVIARRRKGSSRGRRNCCSSWANARATLTTRPLARWPESHREQARAAFAEPPGAS